MNQCMRGTLSTLLCLTFMLGACSNDVPATEVLSTRTPVPATVLPTATAIVPIATETAVPEREAVFHQIENNVLGRSSSTDDFIPASVGMGLHPGGGAETGADSRARLDFSPEGTIVRIGPNSTLSIPEISEVDGEPKSTIELFFGKIFILLNGGSLDVNAATGLASVRGSLLSVEYIPEEDLLIASCLEGHCSLANRGGEKVELIAGEFSYIKDGGAPAPPERIGRDEIQQWLDLVPELRDFLEVLPDPNDYPETRFRDDLRNPDRRPGDNDHRPGDGEGRPRG